MSNDIEKSNHVLEEQSVNSLNLISSDSDSSKNKIDFEQFKISRQERWKLFWTLKKPRYEEKSNIKNKLFVWYPAGISKYERKLLFKLDTIILSYCCLSFFIRMLDANNISNAYISGMKEDFHMHGNMYNWLTKAFYISYSIFGLPLTLLTTKIRPHILLPIIEALWGTMCLLTIACKNYKHVMAVRVIQGALEGACFPSLLVLLGSWYNSKTELSVRTAIFISSGNIGSMFSGYLQAACVKLDGKGGLPGWKWIFIVDFIITMPIALLGWFIIPDTPIQPRPSKFLSVEDIQYCKERLRVLDKVEATDDFNIWRSIKKMLSSWQFYLFNLLYTTGHLPGEVGSFWGIVLKSQGYNIYQRNTFPTLRNASDIIFTVLLGLYVDIRGKKWEGIAFAQVVWIVGVILIVAWDVPRAAQFVGFIFTGMSGPVSSLGASWANEMCKEDVQLRAGVIGAFNLINVLPSTVFVLTAYNTDYAPRFRVGNRISLGILIANLLTTLVIIQFDRYQRRKRDVIEDRIKLIGNDPGEVEELEEVK